MLLTDGKFYHYIPLATHINYRLGIALGSKLWYDFSNDDDWNAKLAGLLKGTLSNFCLPPNMLTSNWRTWKRKFKFKFEYSCTYTNRTAWQTSIWLDRRRYFFVYIWPITKQCIAFIKINLWIIKEYCINFLQTCVTGCKQNTSSNTMRLSKNTSL